MADLKDAFQEFNNDYDEEEKQPQMNSQNAPIYSPTIEPQQQQQSQSQQLPQQQSQQLSQQPQQLSQQLLQQPQQYQQRQQFRNKEQFHNYGYNSRYPEYSFWDRMVMSKREVLKLFILSIVIILAISLEKVGSYYLNSYLTSTDLSSFQELMVRLSFPIIIFLFLWIIKSL